MNKFIGSNEEYKVIIDSLKLRGKWEPFDQGLRYKTRDGGIIVWYNSTGTITFQGGKDAQKKLKELVVGIELDDYPVESSDLFEEVVMSPSKSSKPINKIFVVHGK